MKVVEIFPNEAAMFRLVAAVLLDQTTNERVSITSIDVRLRSLFKGPLSGWLHLHLPSVSGVDFRDRLLSDGPLFIQPSIGRKS